MPHFQDVSATANLLQQKRASGLQKDLTIENNSEFDGLKHFLL